MSDIEITPIETETIIIPILGLSPLIIHRFSEKAKRFMLDKMQGHKPPKEARDPEDDYKNAFYFTDTGEYGFPVIGFKAATVDAARYYRNVTMTGLRQYMFFDGVLSKSAGQKLVTIHGEPHMREDVVRIGQTTDLRYRPQFTEWTTELTITYVTSMLSRESILSLVEAGGMGVGAGEWRPEKGGESGTYCIDQTREIEAR